MPIVLYNPTSRGKFMKYVSVGGVVKSVWVDAFKEYLVPEVDSTDALVNKVDKARIERAEELENSTSLNAYLYREKLAYLRQVTEEARWQKRISDRFSSKLGILMIKGGVNYAFSVDSLGDLSSVGSIIYTAGVSPVRLTERYDGNYIYNGDTLTIESGEITLINGEGGSDSYILRNILGTTNTTVYVESGVSPVAVNTQFYQDSALESVFPSSTTFRYDVPASDTNRKLTLSNGRVTTSQTYTMQAPQTFYLSGATGTSAQYYIETGIDVTDPTDDPVLFSDDQGIINNQFTGNLLTLDPWQYYIVSSGRVIFSAPINQGGGGGGTDSYVFTQGRTNTTVYVSAGTTLVVGTLVYTDAGLSSPLADGDYTNGGKTYTIAGGNGRISAVR